MNARYSIPLYYLLQRTRDPKAILRISERRLGEAKVWLAGRMSHESQNVEMNRRVRTRGCL